jgi:hypothetical protein
MKKLLTLMMALIMVVGLTACGKTAQTPENSDAKSSENAGAYATSLELLSAVWQATPEDNRFSSFGGNQTENSVMDAPGEFKLTDTEGLSYLLLIPKSVHANLDNAASLVHLMNANTFTGAVVHVTGAAVSDVATEIESSIVKNQFMCGFPDKLVMLTLDDYILYAFGSEDLVNSFRDTAVAALTGEVAVRYDQWLA